MSTTINDKVFILFDLNMGTSNKTLRSLIVLAVKMILYNIKLVNTELETFNQDFTKGKIETAYLPILVAAKESFGIFMTLRNQWNSFFSLSGYSKIRKFF
jgi:hypothetical protein